MGNKNKKAKKNKLGLAIKILLIILLLLLLLSLGILLVRLTDFLPNYRDIIFIEPKVPEVEFSDDNEVWNVDTQIDIFRVSDINESGEITVESSDGSKIIAPGMEGSYRFYVKNLGNIAVDLTTELDVYFDEERIDFDYDKLPIEVRFTNYRGEHLTGDDWISISDFIKCIDELTIGKNSYVYYNLDWRWMFETGNDALDTFMGNLSAESDLDLTVSILASAVQSEEYDAEGGLSSGGDDPITGGDFAPVPYIMLNVIILLIIIALIILEIIKRKKKSKEIEKFIEDTEVDEEEKPTIEQ